MITHYGLFWSERDVFWGRPNKKGELLGREKTPIGRRGAPTAAEKQKSKNYRDYIGVYCLYDSDNLLYIGEAGLGTKETLFSRLHRHRTGSMASRWDRFSWFGREKAEGNVDVLRSLELLEAITIAIINPGFNKQAGAFKNAKQVYQVPSELAEGNFDTKLARIAEMLDRL